MGRRTAVLLCLLVGVAGCGGSGDAGQVRSRFAQFVSAMQHRDVARACDRLTPAFWAAAATQVNEGLAASDRSLSTSNCRTGLAALFRLDGNRSFLSGRAAVSHVVVHGRSATARETGGPVPAPVRFVEVGGRWRIDCCAGRQLEHQRQTRYRIPSASMMPTLHLGQIVVSDNTALRRHPALGAIVVFHPPAGADNAGAQCGTATEGGGRSQPCGRPTPGESAQTFIKRVVGLPGDRIAIVGGRVIRNGRPEPRTYKVEPCRQDPGCNFPQPITVPANEYFVLGDNLPASEDSRFWGPVKRQWLIGLVSVS